MKPKLKLKAARAGKNESQADAAKVIGVAEQTYNQKELGKRDFTLTECIKLAIHYNKTLDELFFDKKVNTNKTKK